MKKPVTAAVKKRVVAPVKKPVAAVGRKPVAAPGKRPVVAPVPRKARVGGVAGLALPLARQVVQRGGDDLGPVPFAGTFTGAADGFQVRSSASGGYHGVAQGWGPLLGVRIDGDRFSGTYPQRAGGFYTFQVRPVYRGVAGAATTVDLVGVGEVFITAGQSNASNAGLPTDFAPDARVSTFDGASWRWGVDPQPTLDGLRGGSVWPTMADRLAKTLDVPIGIYCLAYSGTEMGQWQPGVILRDPRDSLFDRLVAGMKYFRDRGGVRAVLWDQGESDYYLSTPSALYEAMLRNLIAQSRAQSGLPVKWVIAKVGGGPTDAYVNIRAGLRQAQANVVDGVTIFAGPDTDLLGLPYRFLQPGGVNVHFNVVGLMTLGGWWGNIVYNLCE